MRTVETEVETEVEFHANSDPLLDPSMFPISSSKPLSIPLLIPSCVPLPSTPVSLYHPPPPRSGRSTLPALAHVSSDEDSPTAASASARNQSLFDPSSFFRPGSDDDEACGRLSGRQECVCVRACVCVCVCVRACVCVCACVLYACAARRHRC